ncbi:MAG: CoA-binding protein, partial [Thaumarchaeota archaeon]|nr:CoA-binding protein [Nitrososphaerota archaeon]
MASNIASILSRMKTAVIVGLSRDPAKYSHVVAQYLKEKGIEVIPVNPTADQIMGLESHPSLSAIPDQTKKKIDVVDIFRRPEDVPPIVDEAIALKKFSNRPIVVWMQLGIVN